MEKLDFYALDGMRKLDCYWLDGTDGQDGMGVEWVWDVGTSVSRRRNRSATIGS